MKLLLFISFCLFVNYSLCDVTLYDPPKMIHIALTGYHKEMVLSWTTSFACESQVNLWKSGDDDDKTIFNGTQSTYLESAGWTHHVKVTGLEHSTKYAYKVGNPTTGWSSEFHFYSAPEEGNAGNFTFIMYGDMGIFQYSYDTVEQVTQAISDYWDIDFIYHAGDFGYGNDRDPMFYETSWNLFFTQMAIPMQKVPYMVTPGNHEESCGSSECDFYANNFTVYNDRFRMPYEESGAPTNMWFSFNYGNIHFISISTETDYPDCPYEDDTFGDQISWLTTDLQNANNDDNVDWIFVTGHQPIYSSVSSKSTFFGAPKGDSRQVQKAFEDLFYQYNVDIYFDGHVHGYERSFPVYKNNVPGQYDTDDYDDPEATIYIVNGSAGNIEGFYDDWHDIPPSWSAKRYWPNPQHGFGVLDTDGASTLTWTWYNNGGDPFNGDYFDKFSITRTSGKRKSRKPIPFTL